MAPLLSEMFSSRTGAHTFAVHKAFWVATGETTDISNCTVHSAVMAMGHSIFFFLPGPCIEMCMHAFGCFLCLSYDLYV